MGKAGASGPLGRFRRDPAGVAGIEFAMLAPFLVLLLVGVVELTRAIDNYRKVTLLARTLADLTAQGDTVTPMAAATMTDIVSSSALVLRPFSSSKTTIRISAMGVYSTLGTTPYVCSSYASNATARTAQAAASGLTVPTQYQTPGMRYVLVEMTSPFTPLLGTTLLSGIGLSSFTFSMSMPWPPRGGAAINSTYAEIILPSGSACPASAS